MLGNIQRNIVVAASRSSAQLPRHMGAISTSRRFFASKKDREFTTAAIEQTGALPGTSLPELSPIIAKIPDNSTIPGIGFGQKRKSRKSVEEPIPAGFEIIKPEPNPDRQPYRTYSHEQFTNHNPLFSSVKYNDEKRVDNTALTSEHYASTDFYDYEKKKVFDRTWLPAGTLCELEKNRILCKKMYGREFVIVKTKKNEIKAFYNSCRHRGARLVKRDCDQKTLICPYHAWRYNLDGELLKTPRFENENFDKKDFGLLEIRCEMMRNIICVNFSDAEDGGVETGLKDHFGGLFDDLAPWPLEETVVVRSKKYYVNSNWKNLIDNFQEYYHLPSVHPGLVQCSRMDDHICTQTDHGKYISFKTDPATSAGLPIDPEKHLLGDYMPGLEKQGLHKLLRFNVLFPNMFWFLGGNSMFAIIVEPISANKSIEHSFFFVHKSVDVTKFENQIDAMAEFYNVVNEEDLTICEEVQRGIDGNDKYAKGIYVKPYEKTVQRFHDFILDMLAKP